MSSELASIPLDEYSVLDRERMEELWEWLRPQFQGPEFDGVTVAGVGAEVGLPWFAGGRVAHETISDYASLNWFSLEHRRGVGKTRIVKLLQIMRARAGDETKAMEAPAKPLPQSPYMDGWDRFPLKLCSYSARTLNYSSACGVTSPGELCRHFEARGEAGIIRVNNAGKRTAAEIANTYQAWMNGDLAKLQEWLPLDDEWRFDLSKTLMNRFWSDPERADVLTRRLVQGKTLEESAAGVSRERVRQVEKGFLAHVEAGLEYFQREREEMFQTWLQHGEVVLGEGCELAVAAIVRSFAKSREGRELLHTDRERVGELVREISQNWDFYCERLDLGLFLQDREAVHLQDAVVAEGEQRNQWQHAGEGRLIPSTRTFKTAALICRQGMGEEEVSADAWLEKLHECPQFRDMPLPQLRHLYGNWKKDEKFQAHPVGFPSGFGDEPAAAGQRRGRQTAFQPARVVRRRRHGEVTREEPPAEYRVLEVLNGKVVRLISELSEPSLLGLLPLEETDQEAILEGVRNLCNGVRRKLLRAMEIYPGAAAYAVSFAVACSMKPGKSRQKDAPSQSGGGFYDAINQELGLDFSGVYAADLAGSFGRAINQLGLVVGVLPEDQKGNEHTYPGVFQAGILQYWPVHLVKAIESYLARNPPPDLEDESRILRFAKYLSAKVPPGQRRLATTLETEVGPLLAKAVMRAVVNENFNLLPPHLQEPIKEAFKGTGADYLKSPFLRFQADGRGFELVLPRQSSRLVDSNESYWEAGPHAGINPLRRRTFPVQDFPGDSVTVRLCRLANKREDQEYEIPLHPNSTEPVFVFRESDGRKLHLPPIAADGDADVEIDPGDYSLVLTSECTTDEEDLFEQSADGSWHGQLPLSARDEPLTIEVAGRTISLRPRLVSGFQVGSEHKLTDDSGQRICFGNSIEVIAHVPESALEEDEELIYRIATVAKEVEPMEVTLLKPPGQGAFCFFDLRDCLIQPYLATLPAGIHQLEITGQVKSRSFATKFYFWKGLEAVSQTDGFRCSETPKNLDWDNSAGLIRSDSGVSINPYHAGPTARLAIANPSQAFVLSKPGLWISVYSTESLTEEHLRLGQSLEINPRYQPELRIVSGDLCDWELSCGTAPITRLTQSRPSYRLPTSALLAEFGEAGTIRARDPFGKEVELVSFTQASVARDLNFEPGHDSGLTKGSFRLGRKSISHLRIGVTDFASFEQSECRHEVAFEPREHQLDIPGFAKPMTLSLEADDDDLLVALTADHAESRPGYYFIDFAIRKPATESWFPLKVAETHNLSDVRLAVPALPLPEGDLDYWGRFLNAQFDREHSEPAIAEIPLPATNEEVGRAIEQFQSVLLFKFPSQVWPTVAWIKSAYRRFCQSAYRPEDDDRCRLFADRALHGLMKKQRESLSVLSALLMGNQGRLLALPGVMFPELDSDGITQECFNQLRVVAAADSLASYVKSQAPVDMELLSGFSNFVSVATNQAPEFEGFQHVGLAERFGRDFEHYQRTRERQPSFDLLSPRHLLEAVRPLNRRLRNFEEVRKDETAHGQLATFMGWIHDAANRAFHVWPDLARHTSLPMQEEERSKLDLLRMNLTALGLRRARVFHLDLIVESDLAKETALVISAVAGLGRLQAAGLLTEKSYLDRLTKLFEPKQAGPENVTDRLSLVLGLGPEVFAFFMLFWELLLKPKTKKS